MLTLDDIATMALALPSVTEGTSWGNRSWSVGKTSFAWERPLTKADIKRLAGEPLPAGPIVAVKVDDLAEKAAVLEQGIRGVFTIAHFDNFPAVLVQLPLVRKGAMGALIVDAWLCSAPTKMADDYLASQRRPQRT